MYIITSKTRW